MSEPKVEIPAVSRPGLRIAAYYSGLFGMVGVMMPFFPVWLAGQGLTSSAVGIVMAALLWARVLINPMAASLADRLEHRRRLVSGLALTAVFSIMILGRMEGFWPILLFAVIHISIQAPVNPLGENLCLLTIRQYGLHYGRLRLWGSVAFIGTSTFVGWWLEGHDEGWVIWFMAAMLLVTFATTLALPDIRMRQTTRKDGPSLTKRRPIRELLSDRRYRVFVGAVAFSMGGHAVLQAFATLHWRDSGLSEAYIGILWSTGVVAEIILFWFSGRMVSHGGRGTVVALLAVGAAAGVLRWLGLGLTTDPVLLLPLQALHGLTFGATHLGAMAFISRAVPAELSATAQGLYSSLAMGASLGFTTLIAGPLYEALGGGAFLVMVAWAAVSLLLALLLLRVWPSDATGAE